MEFVNLRSVGWVVVVEHFCVISSFCLVFRFFDRLIILVTFVDLRISLVFFRNQNIIYILNFFKF